MSSCNGTVIKEEFDDGSVVISCADCGKLIEIVPA